MMLSSSVLRSFNNKRETGKLLIRVHVIVIWTDAINLVAPKQPLGEADNQHENPPDYTLIYRSRFISGISFEMQSQPLGDSSGQ